MIAARLLIKLSFLALLIAPVAARANPVSFKDGWGIMPAYGSRPGLTRVGRAWRDRPILSDQAIEDVVAYLADLKQ